MSLSLLRSLSDCCCLPGLVILLLGFTTFSCLQMMLVRAEMPESCADVLSTAHETAAEALTKKQRKLLKLQKKRQRQAEAVEGYAVENTQQQDTQEAEHRDRPIAAGSKNDEQAEGEEEAQAEWWMCDGCGKGIRGGKKRCFFF